MSLTKESLTRLCRDYREIRRHPIPGANAMPLNSSDMSIWKGVVSGYQGSKIEGINVYFGLEFKPDYPNSPPHAFFITPITTSGAASHKDAKGRTVVCLSLFGNYYNYHSDWKAGKGAGWCASYTVTTILNQLMELINSGTYLSQTESALKKMRGVKVPEEYQMDIPPFPEDSPAEPEKSKESEGLLSRLAAAVLPGKKAEPKDKAEAKEEPKDKAEVKDKAEAKEEVVVEAKEGEGVGMAPELEALKEIKEGPKEPEPLPEDEMETKMMEMLVKEYGERPVFEERPQGPICYVYHHSAQTGALGVCVSLDFVIFPGNYLSYAAYQGGTRATGQDQSFTYWMPVYLSFDHWGKHREDLVTKMEPARKILKLESDRPLQDVITIYMKVFTSTLAHLGRNTKHKIGESTLETLLVCYRTIQQIVTENDLDAYIDGELMMFLESDDPGIIEGRPKSQAVAYITERLAPLMFSERFGWPELRLRVEILVCEWNSIKLPTPEAPKQKEGENSYAYRHSAAYQEYERKMAELKYSIPMLEVSKTGELLEFFRHYPLEWIDTTFGIPSTPSVESVRKILSRSE